MMKFELEPYHRNLSDSDLIEDLKRVALELRKNALTNIEYNRFGKFYSSTLRRRFGSWFSALEKAGLEKTRNLNITDEELFKNLEQVWTKSGRQPRFSEMHKPLSKYGGSSYQRRFGGWRKALEKFIEFINNEKPENVAEPSEESAKFRRRKTKRSISWKLRFTVMRRDNFKCRFCGASPAMEPGVFLEVDHIVPWSCGGETELENLQTLCLKCNSGKSNT